MKQFLIRIFVMLMIFSFMTSNVIAQEDHEETDAVCDTPTQFIEITGDKDNKGALAFDKDTLNVDKDTCVQITFTNMASVIEHDFTVDEDADNGFHGVHVHIANNTAGINNTSSKTALFKTPAVDITYEFYCSVQGHKGAGMVGDLIVGDGSKAPGFELTLAITAILAMIAIPQLRKRN